MCLCLWCLVADASGHLLFIPKLSGMEHCIDMKFDCFIVPNTNWYLCFVWGTSKYRCSFHEMKNQCSLCDYKCLKGDDRSLFIILPSMSHYFQVIQQAGKVRDHFSVSVSFKDMTAVVPDVSCSAANNPRFL